MGSLLDGNVGGSRRHDALFTLATYLRDLGWQQGAVEGALVTAARGMGHRRGQDRHAAREAMKGAYRRKANGDYLYRGPGFHNKEGGRYQQVLAGICLGYGCPTNCPAFSNSA